MKDLIILAADLDTENVLTGLLPRLAPMGLSGPFSYALERHPYRDNGCANHAAEFLRGFAGQYKKALVIFDLEGSGQEALGRVALEQAIEQSLVANGWAGGNVAAIAIDPEVENWIWVNSPHVARALNWKREDDVYHWLAAEGWLIAGEAKPRRPKEAMETVLRKITKRSRSAAIYKQIAEKVNFTRCEDAAFRKLLTHLTTWFPAI